MKYPFKGFGRYDSICDVKIYYSQKKDKYIVLFTELDENEGTSVTNAAEQLCAEIYLQYLNNVNLDNILFFEKYPYQDFYSIIKIINNQIHKYIAPLRFAGIDWKFYSIENFDKFIKGAKIEIS